ncbi:MAG: tRNA (N(6)-L-threonylcarbamoyladenosine(37)-C(2))-methylthiotransferase MtaB [Opitutaceae bacterium]|nr:tRNA (N(6)-L-threonylcarbamoyladenosine(37)-C(2))-methylthiotransferase MtaB [Opitutaceae bacterium]|tara:strand:- start:4721 stop:6073 length:1353 start_codon:yes stop_codon:yes gene_type:complete
MVSILNNQLRASVHTLGCRLNQSETFLLRDQLVARGYHIVPFGEPSDLAIINTCTVTRSADAKCRAAIRGYIRKNPQAFVAVVGCYSQIGYKAISEVPGVDLIMGNREKFQVLDYASLGKNDRPVIIRDRLTKEDFSIDFVGDTPFNKRANLKIQDGCSFICSFCIIPKARGPARSRDLENLLDEARQLVDRGVRELVLTGVNIGTYQSCDGDLLTVLDLLNEIPGLDRIRISSIEPTTIPAELFPRMNDPEHALLPFMHIPLQSGSNAVLKSMRRKYELAEYLEFLYTANEAVEDLCIGTDIMVGYPTEGEAEFKETCRTFLENPFSYCHVFTFSERETTPAARLKGNDMPVKQLRSAKLRRLSEAKRYAHYESYVGKQMTVLFEDPKDGRWPGYTDNYIRVVAKSDKNLQNQLAHVRMDRVVGDVVEGTVCTILADQKTANRSLMSLG